MAPAQMPPLPNKEDLHSTWKYLQTAIDKIMLHLEAGLDNSSYMGVYSAVHNFCTAQKAINASNSNTIRESHRGAHLLGEELYEHLINYLKGHLATVLKASTTHTDEALLNYYIKEWTRYTTSAKYINHLFKYLNRHWVKREMDEGKKTIYDVYTLHLVRWKEDLFLSVQSSVMQSVLRMVKKQRDGETIETARIKSIVGSFVSLGLDESDNSKSNLEVYRFYFEKPFLAATKEYYAEESKRFVAENSVIEYMKKADQRLQEEKDRVGLYLHQDIEAPLMKECQIALISDHSGLLRDEFQSLLENDRQDDLARMYMLLSRISDGLEPLRTKFEAHVRKAGLAAVEKIATGSDNLDPKIYVDALLDVHAQYHALVLKAFNGDAEFVRSLDNACREFVNRNTVCKAGTSKTPELLAKYTDALLKKTTKTAEEADTEHRLAQIMTVFKYVEDKDVFQKFYSRMLARRLVHSTSASDDAETSMISKLKEACGFEFTNKLQRMFQDIQVSKDLNQAYKTSLESNLDKQDLKKVVDAYFNILSTGFWPLQPPNTHFLPPEILTKTYERFQSFYVDKHSGRRLTWLWNLCKGEVKANYCRQNKGAPYTFQVSTFQMAILLLFNDQDALTYEDIKKATSISDEFLEPSLGVFVKAKVLNIAGDGTPTKYSPDTKFLLNFDFKSRKFRINLNMVVKSEQKAEVEDTHKTIEEDRKLLMQSAIVRIMKSRKKMKHVQLVQETITQITPRFNPKIPDIKKCIDILLEKEYLERLDNEELGYLA